MQLSFENLNITIDIKNKNKKQTHTKYILNDLNGVIKAGKFTAIMGPSGSGKTTLLNFLSGRMESRNLKVYGKLMLNTKEIKDLDKFNHLISYV